MPLLDIKCPNGHLAETFCALSSYVDGSGYPTPACDQCGAPTVQAFLGHRNVIDDTLTGGARWMHNLGDKPVWIETKTQLKQELAARGLVQAERNSYNRDDRSPYATRTCLRPGQRDPFLQGAK